MAAVTASVFSVLVMTTSAKMQSVMKVSVTAMFVMAISEGSGRCIGYRCFGYGHVSDDAISDEGISDSYVRDGYQ